MSKIKEILKRFFHITEKQPYYYFTFMGIQGRIYSQRLKLISIGKKESSVLKACEQSRKDTQKLLEKSEEINQYISRLAENAEEGQRELLRNVQLLLEQSSAISSKAAGIEEALVTHMDFLESCDYIVEPAKLLANQFCGEAFDGFDLIIKYAAIESLENQTAYGLDLYQKLYEARGLASHYTIERFAKLIDSFKEHQHYIFAHPIEVDSAGIILDGAHRLACAIYFKVPYVTLRVKRKETASRDFKADFFLENGFSKKEFRSIVEKQRQLFLENGLLTSMIFWADSEQSAFDFETILNRSKKFKLAKGMKLYLSEGQFQEMCRLSKDCATGSMLGIQDASDIFSEKESKAVFYIYWYEVSNSNPVYHSDSERLENHRIQALQRSLKLNITEDEAVRKEMSVWWTISNDPAFNKNLLSFLREKEAREIDVKLRRKIYELFYSKKQAFGRGQFYQSFPLLGIDGQRPTEKRLLEYGTDEILRENFSVLDIGCNCGFLDLTIAQKVRKITGIEYNKTLVKIAQTVAKRLGIKNVDFLAVDFNMWPPADEEETYDVIFSFAVHHWLKTTPDAYARKLYHLLNPNGYIVFESQRLDTIDTEFHLYCAEFLNAGMRIIKEGTIEDDGIIKRKYLVLQKN